jgi:hypothetical protein
MNGQRGQGMVPAPLREISSENESALICRGRGAGLSVGALVVRAQLAIPRSLWPGSDTVRGSFRDPRARLPVLVREISKLLEAGLA